MSNIQKSYENALIGLAGYRDCPTELIDLAWEQWLNHAEGSEEEVRKKVGILIGKLIASQRGLRNLYLLEKIKGDELMPAWDQGLPTITYSPLCYYITCFGRLQNDGGAEIVKWMLKNGADPDQSVNGYSASGLASSCAPTLVGILQNYKMIQENQELKEQQQVMQNQMNQMMDFLNQMKIATPFGQPEPGNKRIRTGTDGW